MNETIASVEEEEEATVAEQRDRSIRPRRSLKTKHKPFTSRELGVLVVLACTI